MPVRAAAMTLATYATSTTGADIRPSLTRLAESMGVDRSGLSRSVAAAVASGWLAVVDGEPSDGRPRTYQHHHPRQGVRTGVHTG